MFPGEIMSEKKLKDLTILAKFVEVYCKGKHIDKGKKHWRDKQVLSSES
jgi:hypothetical protein